MFEIIYLTKNTTIHQEIEGFLDEWNNDLNLIRVKTSGSTGTPKEIEINKEHMRASARMTIDFLKLNPHGTALLCLSPTTIAGKMMIVRSIINEMKLIVVEPDSNPLKDIDERIDFCAMVPLQVQSTLDLYPQRLESIGSLIIGGGAINDDLMERISELKMEVFQTFGMTETISHIAMLKLTNSTDSYQLLPGVSITTHNQALVINAPHLGVYDLETNDLVEIIDSNRFRWLGRKDFVINSGGIKIHPEQIEKKLGRLLKHTFFSYGIQDDRLGQMHILCVEGKVSILKNDLLEILDKYEIPKEIYFFKNFNYTHSGKIDRLATIDRLRDAEKEIL